MLLNKYQYNSDSLSKRGYSQNCIVSDESGKQYWAKWILGIEKTDTKAKILSDKLRHLQKARHSALPDIIEYGYDEEQKAFVIVYELLQQVNTFEQTVSGFYIQKALSGIIEIADCLQELHLKYKINHGDIHPGNILIDINGQFYLIDFGLADITKTLSQAKELEIFAGGFAAPEKLHKLGSGGFPYQSDIYSLGKVVEWFFDEKQETIPEEFNIQLQRLLAEQPVNRPTWQLSMDFLKKLASASQMESVLVASRTGKANEIVELLKTSSPIFNLAPNIGVNFLIDIIIGPHICEGVLWLKDEQKLLFNGIRYLSSVDPPTVERKIKDGNILPFKFNFTSRYPQSKADLTPYFQKWFELKTKSNSLRANRKAVREELGFYSELLNEELKVIAKKSLMLQYSSFKVNADQIIFQIKENEKYSSIGFLQKHIEDGNDVNSDGYEYEISANGDRKQNKESVKFAGKPYDFDSKEKLFKIKDCEKLSIENIPVSGYIFENSAKKEEEKKRQLDAIRKVDKNEVQNPDLIYFLFKSNELPLSIAYYTPLETVWQKDGNNTPFQYSDIQTKAIRNALNKSPLSIIQGPPGTGKTTVITEIVFQILAQKPEAKILITSQTNNAVDQVLENLLKNEIPILRLSGITAPRVPIIRKHTLDRKLEGWKQQVRERAEKNFQTRQAGFRSELQKQNPFASTIVDILLKTEDWHKAKEKIEEIAGREQGIKENKLRTLPTEKIVALKLIDESFGIQLSKFFELQELHRDWIVTINSLDEKSALNQKLVDSIRVIGATCNHIAAKKYSKYRFEFDYVIMDESGKATTAEALVPIITAKNLIFVGDHRQLRPMLTKTREVEAWLREKFKKEADELENWEDYFNRPSLFEQVITKVDPDYKAQLTECRRSSEQQVLLTSKCFYEPEGDDAIVPVPRNISQEHNLPFAIQSSIYFIDIGSHTKNETDGNQSSLNKISAEVIAEILELLNKFPKVKEYSFGVITGYSAQFHELKKRIDKKAYQNRINNICKWDKQEDKLTVSVVDRFQGLERDIIILDLVKSGVGLNLGFLEVPNRINVALSRQKKLLIIVGDYHGIINAKTKRLKGQKAALQVYLESIKPLWAIRAEQIKQLFQ
jgi:superfamily I DNA and/or RNA helicase